MGLNKPSNEAPSRERINIADLESKLKSELWVFPEIENLNKELRTEKDPQKRKELQREKMRILQFAKLNSRNNLWSLSAEQLQVREALLVWKDYNSITKGDLLMLEKYWVNVQSLVMTQESENEEDITNNMSPDSFAEGKKIKVNFWNNRSLNKRMGAWDILPSSVAEISVIPNNSDTNKKFTWWIERKPRTWKIQLTPRIGYHDATGYIPIYDGDIIMVVKSTAPDTIKGSEYAQAKQDELMRERQREMGNTGKPATNLPEDIEAWESTEIPKNQSAFVKKYQDILNKECSKYNIPPGLIIQLIKMESSFDPKNSPKEYGNPNTNAAYWLWQHIKTTWDDVNGKYFGGKLDRTNPEHQIMATCAYLQEMKSTKNCDWAMAVIYYHTWPGVDSANITDYKKSNPGIAKYMSAWDTSAEWYKRAAAKFYQVDIYANLWYTELKIEDGEELIGKTTPDELINRWRSMLNIPYQLGGMSDSGIDCSGFISKSMQDTKVVKTWFRYTAAWLRSFTQERNPNEIQKGDFMFTWWPHASSKRQTYNHIAIVTEVLWWWKVRVLDASWVSSGIWKVAEHVVDIQDRNSFWKPSFYS
jgi:cell wall-associated NlpC family hydrolase